MTQSLLSSGYQPVALLFVGVIVRPTASAMGADKSIQELYLTYGARVKCREIWRGGIDIGSETTPESRKAGFELRVAHWMTGGIDITGWGFQFPSTSDQCALPNLIRRPRRYCRMHAE